MGGLTMTRQLYVFGAVVRVTAMYLVLELGLVIFLFCCIFFFFFFYIYVELVHSGNFILIISIFFISFAENKNKKLKINMLNKLKPQNYCGSDHN